MFDLELSISAWHKQMLAGGITAPVPLDELEAHLRDDIAGQMKSGVTAENAFNHAIQKIGKAAILNDEFGKIKNFASPWPARICHLVLLGFFVALNFWTGDGFREFSAVYCLLLSLALPLFAGPRPMSDPRISERWFNTMMAGQVCLGISASLFLIASLHPAIGLTLAAISCAAFIHSLRHQSRAVNVNCSMLGAGC